VETIGERIKRLRGLRGLTRADLAYKTDITPQGIAAIENGETKAPSFPVGLKIARALNTEAWEIAFGKPEPRRTAMLIKKDADLAEMLASLEASAALGEAEKREDRLARLERYAMVHHQVLQHLFHASMVADRLPGLLERLGLLVPGSEALVAEIRTLREST
jgi:transcriptional regulator with XRE-family HTH domain